MDVYPGSNTLGGSWCRDGRLGRTSFGSCPRTARRARSRRIDHPIEAWRGLMAVANRKDAPTPDQNDAFEAALTDIMLLGEAAEIHATESFIRAAGRSEPTNLDAIVNALRKSLRDELQLGEVALPQDRVLRIDWSDLRGQ